MVWGIHQKSNLNGGATAHGWPDETFFDRLFSELAAIGAGRPPPPPPPPP
eukprot:COSAG01_NODE_8971_length_2598_cov_3.249700_2_plen_49_part_01